MPKRNVIEAFSGTAWATTPEKMYEITAFMEKVAAGADLEVLGRSYVEDTGELHDIDKTQVRRTANGTAIVPVYGTITKRAGMVTRYSGGTSVERLNATLRELGEDDSVRAIVLDVDSPGGSVAGLSEVAETIRTIRANKKVVAVANEMMASAAYWIGSAANEVYTTRNATVGSIGVYMVRPDLSKRMEAEGVKYHLIKAGERKADGMASEPMSDEEGMEFQRYIDAHYQEFISNVATNRNIDMAKATEMADGRVQVGDDAVEAGLADGVKTLDEVVAELDAEASAEDKYQTVAAAYEGVVGSLAEANEKIQAQAAVIEQMKAAEQKRTENVLGEKADAFVASLVADGKVAPKADTAPIREKLMEDFEGTKALYDLVPKGAAAPGEMELDEGTQSDTVASRIEEAKNKGIPVAKSPEQAEVYAGFEIEFVKGYDD